jgi:UDP-N-acetylmuramyl pentapeptide phosphotransferase/UDP-N-acetylglucosamine-1-phosphate transferase
MICSYIIPKIIVVAIRKRLYDEPDNKRKIHKKVIPNLGGVAIFFSYAITASLVIEQNFSQQWNYLLGSTLILFAMGVKDDIITLTHNKKFISQIIAGIIPVCFADIRLHSLYGIFGIYDLPTWFSMVFSIIGCTFITNAFNLIDGVDGLAGTIGVLCLFMLGTGFAYIGNHSATFVSFAMMGAIIGFLSFNVSPAKIFMGDSGALVIGFTISILSILFVNNYSIRTEENLPWIVHSQNGAIITTLAVIFIPVFDSFRVFLTRIAKGRHPFHADRTHIHHFLIDIGFSHSHAVSILITANILIITIALYVQEININIAIGIMLLVSLGLFSILFFMRKAQMEITQKIIKQMSEKNDETGTFQSSQMT